MNKKIITIAFALTFPLTAAAFPGGEGGRFGGHHGHKLERLAEKLDLTAEQKSKLEVIFKQRLEKFKLIRQETHAQMKNVLSAEQMTKLDDMKKLRKEKRQERQEQRKNKKQNKMQN